MGEGTHIEKQVTGAAKQAEGLLKSKYGLGLLAMISFVESALPIPLITDPFLVAYILANRTHAVRAVVVTTLSSIIGGLAAYLMAVSFYYFAIQYLSSASVAELNTIIEQFQEGTFLITLAGAVTPVPYTLVALGAGFVQGSLFLFLLASVIGRGGRYAVVGYVTHQFGPRALRHIKHNLEVVTVIGLFAVLAYLIVHLF